MEIKANYHSVIAIGGFNPAILTPDFLREYCSFQSDHEPTGITTPVTTKLKYGNIEFVMELNRFQIKLEEIEKFGDNCLTNIMLQYLRVLEYTPVNLLGVNFNYSLSEANNEATAILFEQPLKVGEKLNIVPISLTVVARKPDGGGIAIAEATVNHLLDEHIKNSIRISLEPGSLSVNNNFEIGNLEENRDKIDFLDSKYSVFLDNNEKLIAKLRSL